MTTEVLSPARRRAQQQLESVRRHREGLLNNHQLAIEAMRKWLSDGEWWSRQRLLKTHAIKKADYLTQIVGMMIEAGEVEVGQWKTTPKGQGQLGTYYRLKTKFTNCSKRGKMNHRKL